MDEKDFKKLVAEGIPEDIPPLKPLDPSVNHAPARKQVLNREEKKLAVRNALRYFPPDMHRLLAKEFARELKNYGRIYMYRFRPGYPVKARNIYDYPHRSLGAAAIMLMISNNLDPEVAQHPDELITYGGNGAVFQNWAQYRLTMKYLAEMTDEQTLVIYSGHPLGLFPSRPDSPRVVVTNGMVIPNYSSKEHYEKFNALGVTQYGQMTAGSYMYIGPQGIVHGTTITILNAARKIGPANDSNRLRLFVSSGLGGMSGAQPKAARIAGCISVIAEINSKPLMTRYKQGWVDEIYDDCDKIIKRIGEARKKGTPVSIAYHGNIVDLWEELAGKNIKVDIGSDQTSLHNPFSGGYYPAGLTFEESNKMMVADPDAFAMEVRRSLKRHAEAINRHTSKGMYFFDYGNAFLLEASRAGADVTDAGGKFRYPSYVQDLMGPLCFDYGFGPFRWVCCSGDPDDLAVTDRLAAGTLKEILRDAPQEIRQQLEDNIHWIENAAVNNLVVGSQARILYADAEGRVKIALAFNDAVASGKLKAPVVIGRDHHDVSGTDSPFRETSNIYDGSAFTADMSVHNVIGDSFRGATWVSLHNGGGVGWGEVINGGFGLLIDGTAEAAERIRMMLHWDVNNGIARRCWAGNSGARFTLLREMERTPGMKVTVPFAASDDIIEEALND